MMSVDLNGKLTAPELDSDVIRISGTNVLGGNGKINSQFIPAIAISNTFPVSNQIAMLATSAETGDIAVRSDENKSYILSGTDPSILGHWTELLTPTDSVLSVDGNTGVVDLSTSYADIGHNHDSNYLKLTGGTLTGDLSVGGTLKTPLNIETPASSPGYLTIQKEGLNPTIILGDGGSAVDVGMISLYENNVKKIQMYAGGDSYFNGGNLGIGDTSPDTLLHVKGAGQANKGQLIIEQDVNTVNEGAHIFFKENNSNKGFFGFYNSASFNNNENFTINNYSTSGSIMLRTNGSNALEIKSTGNIESFGDISAVSFTGDGSNLTNVPVSSHNHDSDYANISGSSSQDFSTRDLTTSAQITTNASQERLYSSIRTVSKSGNYTFTEADLAETIAVSSTGPNITMTLPDTGPNKRCHILNGGTSGTVTIQSGNGSIYAVALQNGDMITVIRYNNRWFSTAFTF
jgi:hypothetical protein